MTTNTIDLSQILLQTTTAYPEVAELLIDLGSSPCLTQLC